MNVKVKRYAEAYNPKILASPSLSGTSIGLFVLAPMHTNQSEGLDWFISRFYVSKHG